MILFFYTFLYFFCTFRIFLGYFSDTFRILLGYFWSRFGILLGYFCDTFRLLLRYFWDIFGYFWNTFLDSFWTLWGFFWDHFGLLLGYIPVVSHLFPLLSVLSCFFPFLSIFNCFFTCFPLLPVFSSFFVSFFFYLFHVIFLGSSLLFFDFFCIVLWFSATLYIYALGFFVFTRGGASRLRVCYQRGLHPLVLQVLAYTTGIVSYSTIHCTIRT